MESVCPGPEEARAPAVPNHFLWNYWVHCIEGGLYLGGLAFVASNTVLPKMVESLDGPSWLISLMPVIMSLGFVLPPLLTAHWIEGLDHVKPLLIYSGAFQRLPYLVAAIALIHYAPTHPGLALGAVALAPFASGIFGGLTVTAWWELVAKTIPAHRRSSVWAIRFILSALIGIGAGGIISTVLDRDPGPFGYGILHLFAFGFLFLSFLFFALIKEEGRHREIPHELGLLENLRGMPSILRSDCRLKSYLLGRAFSNGIFIVTPFLSIHALHVLEKPESYLGVLVTAQMIGGIAGNLIGGYFGDKQGGKIVLMGSQAAFVLISLWSMAATSEASFLAIFFLYGLAFYCSQVGHSTLAIEICPLEKRATYLSLIAIVGLPSMLAASAISTLAWRATESLALLGALSALTLCVSIFSLERVEEPRNDA
jgi:MFS family permease